MDDLARARAACREHARLGPVLVELRTERDRLASQLAIAEQARVYEQADVDRLTRGVGSFFRAVLSKADLTKEQEELAAAQLLCDELSAELRAVEVEIGHVEKRAAAVANADAEYRQLLAEREARARARGEHDDELDAIAETEAELEARRQDVAGTIATAIEVQHVFTHIIEVVRQLEPYDPGYHRERIAGEDLFKAITGRTSTLYRDLCNAVARAQQGLFAWEQACARIIEDPLPLGLASLRVELPSIEGFVRRSVLWTNEATFATLVPEVSRVSSLLAWRTGELRERDAALAKAQAECARMRARLLDPERQ